MEGEEEHVKTEEIETILLCGRRKEGLFPRAFRGGLTGILILDFWL